jgi:plastocyanin
MAFDEGCFQIEPGPVEFTFVNDDDGVSHNLHVSGQGVNEATPLERGKTTQVLELELTEPGTYDFKCDPHPETMKGQIVVADASSTSVDSTSAS